MSDWHENKAFKKEVGTGGTGNIYFIRQQQGVSWFQREAWWPGNWATEQSIEIRAGKTFNENWDGKAPSAGTLLAYLETTA